MVKLLLAILKVMEQVKPLDIQVVVGVVRLEPSLFSFEFFY